MLRTWYNAAIWLGYSVCGILISVGIGLLVLAAMGLDITVGAITNAGQFALYSTGMWTTTYYQITKPSSLRLPFTEVFGLISFVGLSLAVAFFVLATMFSNGVNVNSAYIQWPSISLFVVSAIAAFLAVRWDDSRMQVDMQKSRRDQQQALGEAFDRTQDQ